MLDFRKEIIRTRKEGITREDQDLEKQVNFLLKNVLNVLEQEKYIWNFICTTKLVFINSGEGIHVKASKNHSRELFYVANHNSLEIFNTLKQKFKRDNFEISDEEENTFTIHLD